MIATGTASHWKTHHPNAYPTQIRVAEQQAGHWSAAGREENEGAVQDVILPGMTLPLRSPSLGSLGKRRVLWRFCATRKVTGGL